jgi:3-dehydroquinate dehydratase / shikimate dehydrogenase
MLCVSLMGQSNALMMEAAKSAAAAHADLVEIRLDALQEEPDYAFLFGHCPLPTIATHRREQDGGLYRGDEEQRIHALHEAARSGATYIDIELDSAALLPHHEKTQTIVSHHILDHTPEDLTPWERAFSEAGGHIHKFVTFAQSATDAFRVLQFNAARQTPTIRLAMGEYGRFSRVLCLRHGAPWTYVAESPDQLAAPGQLCLSTIQSYLLGRSLDASTKVFGVVGSPIGHSMSPPIHNAAYAEISFDGIYVPFLVSTGDFESFLNMASQYGLNGLSITLPHKESAFLCSESADPIADHLKVANTLTRGPRGWHAANTDAAAAMRSIKDTLRQADIQHLQNLQVLILGSGGVAKTVGALLTKEGAQVSIASRNPQRGQALASETGGRWVPWEERLKAQFRLLINATPVGMFPNIDESPFPPEHLTPQMVVYDSIYRPHPTALVRAAQSKGAAAIDGFSHFLMQAADQFAIFTQKEAPMAIMENKLQTLLSP